MVAEVFLASHPDLVNGIIRIKSLVEQAYKTPYDASMILVLDIYGVLHRNGIDQNLLELVKRLHENGIDVYLASNTTQSDADARKALGKGTIKGAYCSQTIGVGKPDKQFYQYICDDLGLIPTEVLFFDDSPSNILSANNFGWHAYEFQSVADIKKKCKFHMNNLEI